MRFDGRFLVISIICSDFRLPAQTAAATAPPESTTTGLLVCIVARRPDPRQGPVARPGRQAPGAAGTFARGRLRGLTGQ